MCGVYINNDLVRVNRVSFWGYNDLGLVFGDNSKIVITLLGVYCGNNGDTLSLDNGYNITFTTPTQTTPITLLSPSVTQTDHGIRITSSMSGYKNAEICTFTASFALIK